MEIQTVALLETDIGTRVKSVAALRAHAKRYGISGGLAGLMAHSLNTLCFAHNRSYKARNRVLTGFNVHR